MEPIKDQDGKAAPRLDVLDGGRDDAAPKQTGKARLVLLNPVEKGWKFEYPDGEDDVA